MKKGFVSLFGITLILVSIATLTTPVNAAQLTVGTSGHYRTITDAVNAAHAGDTIRVGPGTYAENVVITKPLTIIGSNGPTATTTVTAADPGRDVFQLQGAGIHVGGLTATGATGAAGVHVNHATGCTVTGISAFNNKWAVYLDGANNCEVSNSNLANNGYGVYGDSASHNTISGNLAEGERGAPPILGDGVYLFRGGGNTVDRNNLSANHVFGISLYYSPGNTITHNSILRNENIGIRLGYSNNNVLTFNTYSGNVNSGIVPVGATGNKIYLNNFVDQQNTIGAASQQTLNSLKQMAYTFGGASHTSYMSNYYSDYRGSDRNGDGIGTTPSANGDKYPLVRPFEAYGAITVAGAATPTPHPQQPAGPQASTTASQSPTRVPGFEAGSALIGMLAIAFVLTRLRVRGR